MSGRRQQRAVLRRARLRAQLAVMLLVGASCGGRAVATTPSPEIPVRIDPVPLPLPTITVASRAELRQLADSLVSAPRFANAHWGVLVVDPVRGDTLLSLNADKLFMPASNQKIITGAAAFTTLGGDYQWRTPVLLRGTQQGNTFRGDIVLVGSGDPSWSEALHDGSALAAFEPVREALAARNIRRVVGRVVAEGDAFADAPHGYGWSWDDLDLAYSAGVDELMFNEGFFRVIVHSGARAGAPATARTEPLAQYPALRVTATTRERTDSVLRVNAPLRVRSDSAALTVDVLGSIPRGDSAVFVRAYRHPNDAARAALREALARPAVSPGGTAARPAAPIVFVDGDAPSTSARTDTLVVLTSPPLDTVMQRLQKPSQNQIAESVYKTIGLAATGVGTADSARAVIERQLATWGVPDGQHAVRDGSGLSRHNYLSPRTIVRVLDVMRTSAHFNAFYAALPVAGVDGTIATRLRGTAAEGNVRAKTGTLDKARSLSGYLTTVDGQTLVFSMLCNNWTVPVRDVEAVQDLLVARMAAMRLSELR